jgi:hypothetical protein
MTQIELYANFSDSQSKEPKYSSNLLNFLKSGIVSNDILKEIALPACENHVPNQLIDEMIYILAELGDLKRALHLLITEVKNVADAIEFIEKKQMENANKNLLWDYLIDFAVKDTSFLEKLLDFLGLCSLNPVLLISKIPDSSNIKHLRSKLLKILDESSFQSILFEKCNILLEQDALQLSKQQNQGQRRAIKINDVLRCASCSRFLNLESSTVSQPTEPHHKISNQQKKSVGIQSNIRINNEVILLSNKLGFHKSCFKIDLIK